MANGPVTRRRVLAAVATGTVASLAGCSFPHYDDRLRVAIPAISATDAGFVGRVTVHNDRIPEPDPGTGTGDDDPHETKYEGVRFLGYAHDGEEVLSVSIGDLEPREAATEDFETNRFPLVITADADDWSHTDDDDSVYGADRGAHVTGYYGRYSSVEESPVDGEKGHLWKRLGERRLDHSLPPYDGLFNELKCRHWKLNEDEDTEPDFSLVSDSDEWVDQDIPDPTIHHRYWITVTDALDDDLSEVPFVPFNDLPDPIQTAIVEGRNPDWMDREAFLAVTSDLAGYDLDDVDDFPPCDAGHVVCDDDRGEACWGGVVRLTGSIEQDVWYETVREGTRYGIVVSFDEAWKPPDEDPLPECFNELHEEYVVRVGSSVAQIDGVGRSTRVESIPDEAEQYLTELEDESGTTGIDSDTTTVDQDEFEDLIVALEEFDDVRLPDCERRHVDCERDPRTRCGSGERTMYYRFPGDDEDRGLAATYRWERLSAQW